MRVVLKVIPTFSSCWWHGQSSKLSTSCFRCKDTPANEPVLDYVPGSEERRKVDDAISRLESQVEDIPIMIGDEEIRSGTVRYQVEPYNHQKKIAKLYYADADTIRKGISTALAARASWETTPLRERCKIFCKAADLIAGKYRADIVAATMIGQAKNVWQAEIDAVAELADFYRFNSYFTENITAFQPINSAGVINTCEYRGCEGFWAAITPFNFTAIGGHLPMAPALMGNVVLWKPTESALLSNWIVYKILLESGLPRGVINFVPSAGSVFGEVVTESPHLAGINFTGSTGTFMTIWKNVASNLERYKTYPRLIGECGGKNFHFVHKSSNLNTVAVATIRGAFEYSGQKCSACSRAYVPESLWPKLREKLEAILKDVHVGPANDPRTFMSSVIDDKAFARIKGWIDSARTSSSLSVVAGGNCDDSTGYFIEPTILQTTDPHADIMKSEIFGPVLTVYVYPDDEYLNTAHIANETSDFGLTGAIFAKDESVIKELTSLFRDSVGNLYINDKATGSVVAQQPFGGARLSGTNDKAGGPLYLSRFMSMQSVKASHVNQSEWRYPSMGE